MGSVIAITSADGHVFAAYAAGSDTAPRAVVVCHDFPGLNRHIRLVCDQIAALGFQVIAPALFDRVERDVSKSYRPESVAYGQTIAAAIPVAQLVSDVAAAAAQFKQSRIGIVGLGWGGLVAWHAAAKLPILHAAVSFYAAGIGEARQETPLCPVQLHCGEWDKLVPLADVDAVRHAQPQVEIEVYQNAGHHFMCEELEAFNPTAAESARDNMMAFLRKGL